jgi:hypothetical protein
MEHLHLTTDLISKVDEVEFLYTQDRMDVIRDFRKEPGCVQYIERENLRGVMFPSLPNPFFNRILLSGAVSPDVLGEVLDAYQAMGAPLNLEISPGAVNEEMAKLLQARGFAHTKFLPVFLKPVHEMTTQRSDSLVVKQVSSLNELKHFQELYVTGWKLNPNIAPALKAYIAGWNKFPDWRLYIACLGEQPIGCAVLYMKNSIDYLADATTPEEFRGKGAQTALLLSRFKEAKKLGADVIFSRADFASISQRNLLEKARSSYLLRESFLDEAMKPDGDAGSLGRRKRKGESRLES